MRGTPNYNMTMTTGTESTAKRTGIQSQSLSSDDGHCDSSVATSHDISVAGATDEADESTTETERSQSHVELSNRKRKEGPNEEGYEQRKRENEIGKEKEWNQNYRELTKTRVARGRHKNTSVVRPHAREVMSQPSAKEHQSPTKRRHAPLTIDGDVGPNYPVGCAVWFHIRRPKPCSNPNCVDAESGIIKSVSLESGAHVMYEVEKRGCRTGETLFLSEEELAFAIHSPVKVKVEEDGVDDLSDMMEGEVINVKPVLNSCEGQLIEYTVMFVSRDGQIRVEEGVVAERIQHQLTLRALQSKLRETRVSSPSLGNRRGIAIRRNTRGEPVFNRAPPRVKLREKKDICDRGRTEYRRNRTDQSRTEGVCITHGANVKGCNHERYNNHAFREHSTRKPLSSCDGCAKPTQKEEICFVGETISIACADMKVVSRQADNKNSSSCKSFHFNLNKPTKSRCQRKVTVDNAGTSKCSIQDSMYQYNQHPKLRMKKKLSSVAMRALAAMESDDSDTGDSNNDFREQRQEGHITSAPQVTMGVAGPTAISADKEVIIVD